MTIILLRDEWSSHWYCSIGHIRRYLIHWFSFITSYMEFVNMRFFNSRRTRRSAWFHFLWSWKSYLRKKMLGIDSKIFHRYSSRSKCFVGVIFELLICLFACFDANRCEISWLMKEYEFMIFEHDVSQKFEFTYQKVNVFKIKLMIRCFVSLS